MDKIGNITLIHGDCMEYLRSLPDNAFDLAVVDPPYGDGNFQTPPSQKSNEARWGGVVQPLQETDGTDSERGSTVTREPSQLRALTGRFQRYSRQLPPQYTDNQPKGIWWDIAPSQEYFDELFRVSKNQIIWGGNYFNLPPTRCFLIWRKLSISEKFSMAMCEYAWTSFNANAKVFECVPQGTKKDPRFHPTQKPIKLYQWILERYAKDGDKILDTHLGSGSSAIAAQSLGLEFVGLEIDGEYYEKAKQRLINHINATKGI